MALEKEMIKKMIAEWREEFDAIKEKLTPQITRREHAQRVIGRSEFALLGGRLK